MVDDFGDTSNSRLLASRSLLKQLKSGHHQDRPDLGARRPSHQSSEGRLNPARPANHPVKELLGAGPFLAGQASRKSFQQRVHTFRSGQPALGEPDRGFPAAEGEFRRLGGFFQTLFDIFCHYPLN